MISNYKMKYTNKIVKGAGIAFIGILLGTFLKYLFNIVVARNYGATGLGLFNQGHAIVGILGVIVMLGLNSGVLRYIPRYYDKKGHVKGIIRSTLKIVLINSIIISAIIFLLSKTLAVSVFKDYELISVLKLFAIALPFYALGIMFMKITIAYKKVRYKVVYELLYNASLITLSFIFILLGLGINYIVIAFILSMVLLCIVFMIAIYKLTPIFDSSFKEKRITKKILLFSIPLLLSGALMLIMKKVDILMLGYFTSSSNVGIYSAAARTAQLLIIGLNSFGVIFTPIISELHKKKKMVELENTYKTVTKIIFTIVFPLFLVFITFGRDILAVFDTEFIVGFWALVILSIAHLVNSTTGSCGTIISMAGHSKIILINHVIVFTINIALNIILIPMYGIIGAAIATCSSMVIINIIRLIELYVMFKMHPYKWSYLKPIIAGLISVIIVSFLDFYWLIKVIILGVIYLVFIFIMRLDKEEKNILDSIISKVFKS